MDKLDEVNDEFVLMMERLGRGYTQKKCGSHRAESLLKEMKTRFKSIYQGMLNNYKDELKYDEQLRRDNRTKTLIRIKKDVEKS